MDFLSALKIVGDGGSITRHMWMNPDFHVKFMKHTHPEPVLVVKTMEYKPGSIQEGDGFYHHWTVSREDFFATDWEPVAAIPAQGGLVFDSKAGLLKANEGPILVAQKSGSPRPIKKKVDHEEN